MLNGKEKEDRPVALVTVEEMPNEEVSGKAEIYAGKRVQEDEAAAETSTKVYTQRRKRNSSRQKIGLSDFPLEHSRKTIPSQVKFKY